MTFAILDVRVHGDVAVVLAHGTNRGEWEGAPFAADEWMTEVFIRRRDRWRCSMSALTPNYASAINAAHGSDTVTPCVLYENVENALAFLSGAFGFEETLRYNDPAGYVSHAEMRRGKGTVLLGDPGDEYRSPHHLGAATVQIHLSVDGVDALYQRALDAGATVDRASADHAYGELSFTGRDPEGHVWTFAQTIADVEPQEWGAITA